MSPASLARLAWLSPLVFAACSHNTPPVEPPNTAAPQQQTSVDANRSTDTTVAASQAKSCTQDSDCGAGQRCGAERVCVAASSCGPLSVRFGFNSDTIEESQRSTLQAGASCLQRAGNLRVTIVGNADERGTEEYNLALGDRRALAVEKYLRALGVPEDRMHTISYGEERPVCTEHDEACWERNRRAEIEAAKPSGDPAG